MKTKILLTGALLSTAILAGCNSTSDAQEAPEPIRTKVSVQAVEPGLKRNFSVTGEISAAQSITVTAETKSTVEAINKNVGDAIAEGEELITLKSESVDARYVSAVTSYTTARQNVEQTRIFGDKNVESSRIALESAQKNLDTTIKQNAALRTQAEESLNAASIDLDLATSTAQTSLENTINTIAVTVRNAMVDIDNILEYTGTRTDLDYIYETHIGVKDPGQKIIAKQSYSALKAAQTAHTSTYDSTINLLSKADDTLAMVSQTLDNSVTSREYSQTDLQSDVSTINGHLNSVRSARSNLESAKRTLEQAQRTANGTKKSQSLIDAEAQYAKTIADIEAADTAAREQVRQAEIALRSAEESARASEIGAKSTLANVGNELAQAKVARDKQVIAAAFSGQIIDIAVVVDEELQAGAPVITIENRDLLKIVAYLSSDEARSIESGSPVIIDDTIDATVSTIAPSADPQTKKFKVEIFLQNESLLPGEFTEITFTTSNQENGNGIYVPISTVHISSADTYVWTVAGQGSPAQAQKKSVGIGELQGKFVEITSGLSEGDWLVTNGGRMLTEDGIEVDVTVID